MQQDAGSTVGHGESSTTLGRGRRARKDKETSLDLDGAQCNAVTPRDAID